MESAWCEKLTTQLNRLLGFGMWAEDAGMLRGRVFHVTAHLGLLSELLGKGGMQCWQLRSRSGGEQPCDGRRHDSGHALW
jgi:hypothetical protein